MSLKSTIDNVIPLRDSASQPEDVECRCGRSLPWQWWEPRGGRLAPAWTYPSVDPCLDCTEVDRRTEAIAEHSRRIDKAGVPESLRGRSLQRLAVYHSGRDAPVERWGGWVARQYPRTIGVCSTSAGEAIRVMRDWRPTFGGGWLYVHGPVGSGKSQLVAAMLEDQTKPAAEHWSGEAGPGRPGARTLHRPKRLSWCWIHESVLMERVRQSWSGDKDPLLRICRSDVLVIDDWGIEGTRADAVKDMRSRLIRYRLEGEPNKGIAGGRPTVLVSNVEWSKAAPTSRDRARGTAATFGARMASRLQRCEPLLVTGLDWREHVR